MIVCLSRETLPSEKQKISEKSIDKLLLGSFYNETEFECQPVYGGLGFTPNSDLI
jgi:hypothetical protein